MAQPHAGSNRDQVVDTMIGLTCLSSLHRTIVVGSDGMEFYLALRQRGFFRVATPEICRLPRGQHTIGLIAEYDSVQAIESELARISPFLSLSAAIAVLIDSREPGASLKVRARLAQMGFRIEAGARCQQGLVLSAYRRSFGQLENAA